MYPANTYVDEDIAAEIDESGLQNLRSRSPLRCETVSGICATCYGRDLARGTKVNMGEAVGVIAAQSIGERVRSLPCGHSISAVRPQSQTSL